MVVIISDIIDGVKFIINFFMDKAPRPVQILFFLLLLVAFVSIIPFFLHLVGFHCNSDGKIVRLSPLKVISNTELAFMGKGEIINSTSYLPESIVGNTVSCRKPVCIVGGKYYWQSETECSGQTIVYPYLSTGHSLTRCFDCSGDDNLTTIHGSFSNTETFYLCLGDAYPRNLSNVGIFTLYYQTLYCSEDRCEPPIHYYYDYDTGLYVCKDLDVCGGNNTVIISSVDDLLENAGGELYYPSSIDNKDYRSLVKLTCSDNLSPQITFYGIPVFDYRIWLMLIVIYVMFMFLSKIKDN